MTEQCRASPVPRWSPLRGVCGLIGVTLMVVGTACSTGGKVSRPVQPAADNPADTARMAPAGTVEVARGGVSPVSPVPSGAASSGPAESDRDREALPAGRRAEPVAGAELRTRTARLRVARFEDLPGWRDDDPAAGWDAFQRSCKVLARRAHWAAPCAQALAQRERSSEALRAFFERSFTALQLLHPDASAEGAVTGYFEPLLAGALQPQGAFHVPVYGVPRDLLLLDRRELVPTQRSGVIDVRQEGRELRPLARAEPGSLRLDLDSVAGEPHDRRLRLRRDGDRVLPYFSRAELASRGEVDAPVIAWVDDPLALYAMQIQGSGRIRLTDGRVLRLFYGEQNGHPFRPLRVKPRDVAPAVRTRGLGPAGGEPAGEEPQTFELAGDASPEPASPTRGLRRPTAKPEPRQGAAPDGQEATRAVIEQLLPAEDGAAAPARARARPPTRPAAARPAPSANSANSASSAPSATSAAPAAAPTKAARPGVAEALARDPSYVFFRIAEDQAPDPGPVGALGVALTAGRSVAVDPRSAPLGYPLFLTAESERAGGAGMRKLVFAQDTGGAIRGAVRIDHFWGFGREAGRQAARTNHRGRVWLLVPRAEASEWFVRARPAMRGSAALPVCLVADAEHCFE